MPKLHSIEAQFHMPLDKGYRVKVSILESGIYINGFVVFAPNEEHDYWSVHEPSQKNRFGKYFQTIEFDHTTTLWKEICEACIDEVKIYIAQSRDVVITDIPDAPITLDDIPDFK